MILPFSVTVAAALIPQQTQPAKIDLQVTVAASVAEVYPLFATTRGVKTLFPGAEARIDPRIGGDYCVMFDPVGDPTGDLRGTNGCKFRVIEPNRRLVFDWRGPEWSTEMNVRPFPTKVEVELENAGDGTRVRMIHTGFGQGGGWARSYAFFDRAWRKTMDLLEARFAKLPKRDPTIASVEPTTLYAVRFSGGPKWIADEPSASQPKIANHAAFMHRLLVDGQMYLGGPIGVGEGLAILRVPDAASAKRLIDADPAVQFGTLKYVIEPWRVAMREDVDRALGR